MQESLRIDATRQTLGYSVLQESEPRLEKKNTDKLT